jgi:hypothetical protein
MNWKNWILRPLSTVLVVVKIMDIHQCKPKTWKINNPNLLVENPGFILPENTGERFKQLITKNDLATHFKPGQVNFFYKKNQWIGRIKDNDVSYHALFTMDNSKIICNTTDPHAVGLHFSIFHPLNSARTFQNMVLWLQKILFQKTIPWQRKFSR